MGEKQSVICARGMSYKRSQSGQPNKKSGEIKTATKRIMRQWQSSTPVNTADNRAERAAVLSRGYRASLSPSSASTCCTTRYYLIYLYQLNVYLYATGIFRTATRYKSDCPPGPRTSVASSRLLLINDLNLINSSLLKEISDQSHSSTKRLH